MAKVDKRCLDSKGKIREEIRSRLSQIENVDRVLLENQLHGHLNLFLQNQSGLWGAYRSQGFEISPQKSIEINTQLRWVFPRVELDTLAFYLEPKAWQRGAFGILEPDPLQSTRVVLGQLTGYLIPGVAFDRKGTRLGRGRGFFDRALAQYEGLKVGVAFESQVMSNLLPREPFDIAMDFIITDRGIYKVESEGDRGNG